MATILVIININTLIHPSNKLSIFDMSHMARHLLQGKDFEILGDDWSVGEADLCSRLMTGNSMVKYARNTGGPWKRELLTWLGGLAKVPQR